MKKLHLKLLTTVMVTSSLLATGGQLDQVTKEVFQSFRSMVGSINKSCQNFLSPNNRESMSKHVAYFKTIITQGTQKLKELREVACEKTNLLELVSYAEEMLKEFGRFVAIVDEFKTAGPLKLSNFLSKLKKTIDVQTIFTDITQKVGKLHKKYQNTDKHFVEELSRFENWLGVIVQQWSKRDSGSLLSDIRHRMSIKA